MNTQGRNKISDLGCLPMGFVSQAEEPLSSTWWQNVARTRPLFTNVHRMIADVAGLLSWCLICDRSMSRGAADFSGDLHFGAKRRSHNVSLFLRHFKGLHGFCWLFVFLPKLLPLYTNATPGARRATSRRFMMLGRNGGPGAIRTPDPQIRSLMLYPAALRVRCEGGI